MLKFDSLYYLEKPFLKEREGIVVDVNDKFSDLTGFNREELQGKDLNKVFSELFRNNDKTYLREGQRETILFTKALDVRTVKIEMQYDNDTGIYFLNEVENSRLDNKIVFIENLIKDNKLGIGIYTAPDLKLIKANDKYLSYLPEPCNKKEYIYGKLMKEFIPSFDTSKVKEVFEKVIATNKSTYVTERQGLVLEEDKNYWDNTITPIAENGEVKYVMSILEDVTERVLSREHIKLKNKQLESIIESVDDIISIIDKDGRYIKRSGVEARILGDVEGKYVGYSGNIGKYYDLNGNALPLEELCFMKVLKGVKIKNQNVKYVVGDKEYYGSFSGVPILDENGEFQMGVIITNEITEEIKKSKEIERKNRQLNAIIECIDDMVALIGKDGQFIRQSKWINKNFGQSNDGFEQISKNIIFYDMKDNVIPAEELCTARLLRGKKVIDHKTKMIKDGKEIYVSATGIPIFDENSNFEMGVMVTHDITELVESNKLIRNKKKELQTILDNMHDGLVVIDKNGVVIQKNKALIHAFNNRFEKPLIFERVGQTLEQGQKYYNENNEELSTKDIPSFRVLRGETVEQQRIVIRDGKDETHLDFNAVPIFDEKGNFQYGVIVGHDITDIIQKENRIKQQQEFIIKAEKEKREVLEKALAMKDEFISLITHEFKTPLNVIYSAIQLIDYVYINQVPERVRALLGNIKQNTFRQLRLVNNLLDITRLNSGRFKLNVKNIDIVSLVELITQSVGLYASQKNIHIFFECAIDYKCIAIDDEKLERIILNLLSNAIKFTEKGGSIKVKLEFNEETERIVIEVSDTGIGIPKDKQDMIFERFGQVDSDLSRQAEGTGIGLSLVKQLVDLLGGNIELESELGRGSTFRIILPSEVSIENEEYEACLDMDNRLVNALNVEFSDIYF